MSVNDIDIDATLEKLTMLQKIKLLTGLVSSSLGSESGFL